MNAIGGQPPQQRDALVAALLAAAAVAVLPGVQQPIVVARMLEERQVLVAGGRRKDALQRSSAGQLVLGDNQRAHVVRRQVVEDLFLVLMRGGERIGWRFNGDIQYGQYKTFGPEQSETNTLLTCSRSRTLLCVNSACLVRSAFVVFVTNSRLS